MAERVHSVSVSLEGDHLVFVFPEHATDRLLPDTKGPLLKRFNRERVHDLTIEATRHLRNETWGGLEDAGRDLYDALLPEKLGDVLFGETANTCLVLNLTRDLTWIPWELCFGHGEFLCLHLRVARSIVLTPEEEEKTRQEQRRPRRRSGGALIALGPTDEQRDLQDYEELRKRLKLVCGSAVSSVRHPTREELLRSLKRGYEIVHFVGHGKYVAGAPQSTGLVCAEGKLLSCQDIRDVSSRPPFPLLVFANACRSAEADPSALQDGEAYASDLSIAFLTKGVAHYIGTITHVPDEIARRFARTFYEELAGGVTVGAALVNARRHFFKEKGQPIWACYVHYGNPLEMLTVEPPPQERAVKSVKRTRSKLLGLGLLVMSLVGALLFLVRSRYPPAPAFPEDSFGIAILDFAVQNQSTGSWYDVRYLEADRLRAQLASLTFPNTLVVRNIPRSFRDEIEARQFGEKMRARLVIWGYGVREGAEVVHIDMVQNWVLKEPMAPKSRLRQMFDQAVSEYLGVRKQYEISLAKPDAATLLLEDIKLTLPLVTAADYFLTHPDETGFDGAQKLLSSCVDSPEIGRDSRDICQMALAFTYMVRGQIETSEHLFATSVPTIGDAEAETFLHDMVGWIKYVLLAIPKEHMRDAFGTLRPGEILVRRWAMASTFHELRGDWWRAEEYAYRVMGGIQNTRGQTQFATGDTEASTLSLLVRTSSQLGKFDQAVEFLNKLEQHPRANLRIVSNAKFHLYLAKYRESGDPAWGEQALAAAASAEEHAAVQEILEKKSGLLISELRKEHRAGRADHSRLAIALVEEAIRNGDRRLLEEAIHVCDATRPTWIVEVLSDRVCALIGADAALFLGRERESFERLQRVWPEEALGLDWIDEARLFERLGYVAFRRLRSLAPERGYLEMAREKCEMGPEEWVGENCDITLLVKLGYVAVRRGRVAEGVRRLSKAYALASPEYKDEAALFLAWAYVQAGESHRANQLLNRPFPEEDRLIPLARGLVRHIRRDFPGAIEKYDRSPLGYERFERKTLYLALANLEAGNEEKALEHLRRLSTSPTNRFRWSPSLQLQFLQLGWPWEPRLSEDPAYIAKRIADVEAALSKNPLSVELRDLLFVLYRFSKAGTGDSANDMRARQLVEEAIRLDPRDGMNAAQLSFTPMRRFIDLAILDIEAGKSRQALEDLQACMRWYVGAPEADPFLFEVTSLLDEWVISPRQGRVPPWYVPTLSAPAARSPW